MFVGRVSFHCTSHWVSLQVSCGDAGVLCHPHQIFQIFELGYFSKRLRGIPVFNIVFKQNVHSQVLHDTVLHRRTLVGAMCVWACIFYSRESQDPAGHWLLLSSSYRFGSWSCHKIQQWIRVEQRALSRLPGTLVSKWTSIPLLVQLIREPQPKYVHSLFIKYGPVVRLGPNHVAFSDPAAFQEIYNTENSFAKSSLYEVMAESPVSTDGSTVEAGMHQQQRELIMPALSEDAINRMYKSLSSKVALAIQRMGEETIQNSVTDIYKWWTLMMADIMGDISFGQSVGLLEKGQVSCQTLDGLHVELKLTVCIERRVHGGTY